MEIRDASRENPNVCAHIVGPVVQITGESPFNTCDADDVPGQEAGGSIVYPESEIEPYIDVNPTEPDNLVAVWQQDRWSDGGARGLVSAVSEDGGVTWETVTPPPFSLMQRWRLRARVGPWVTYARNGDVYFHEPFIRL